MALMDENGGNFVTTMPVAPTFGGGCNNGFGGDWAWIILLLLLGWGNNGFGGGYGGNGDFPWLMTGQQNINTNTNNGFRDAMLNDGITSIRDSINGLSSQLCNSFNDMQVSNMQNAFATQNAVNTGFNTTQAQLANCCCENRLGTADLKYTVATENCADRQALNEGVRDIIASNTASTQAILDKLCQQEIDAKNETIAQLRQEVLFARGQASQDVQTARILAGQTAEVDALYNRLDQCPVGTTPVYGRTPIFTCNNGCGCGM